MPRDLGSACKKRQHPDGLHLISSSPKRQLSSSEAEIGSSVVGTSFSPGTTMSTPHGSLCNSASSALLNAQYSTGSHPTHSSLSLDVVSSKSEGPDSIFSRLPSDVVSSKLDHPGYVLSRLPSNTASCSSLEGADWMPPLTPSIVASYDFGTLHSSKGAFHQESGKGIWTYPSDATGLKGLDCYGEMSEVTFEKPGRTLAHGEEPDGVSGSEKVTHIISRRDSSSLNAKDELWHKTGHGYVDHVSLGKQRESSGNPVAAWPQREYRFSSAACESASSCATGDSITPKLAFFQMYRSPVKDSSTTVYHSHARAEVLVEPRLQERSGREDDSMFQRDRSSEGALHPPVSQKAAREELSPSYVLSSGRMSLEEEAKLGRRAPTIDHDFEEYFSSLML